MMEPIFENKMEITDELLKEYSKESFYVLNKVFRILCLLVFIFQSVIVALRFSLSHTFSTVDFFQIALALVLLWIFLVGYKPSLKTNQKQLKILHGKLPESTKGFMVTILKLAPAVLR